ncbi:MAG: lipopolysaccharide biosynthesis protein [Oscillospiraceae bacterium]
MIKGNQRKVGVVLSYLSQAIQILSGLIYTPIMLRLLGQSEYGLYQLVYSVVSYLSLLSLGFGSSYIRFYSRYKADNDENGISKLNGMFMIIFSIISLISILCGSVLVINIESIFSTGLTPDEVPTARILMILMVINLAMTFPNSVFNNYVTAHEQFIFQKLLTVLQNLLNPFITLPLLIMGYGSIAMVSVTTFLTFAKLIADMIFCFKKLHMKFSFKNFDFKLLKHMFVFTFFIFLNQIIDQINWSVDKFLLGRFAGTVAVAIYGVAGQLNSMYLNFSTAISNVFVPKVNKIVAETDDNNLLTELFIKIGRIQSILLFLIITGYIFFGQSFIGFWAGDGYETSYKIGLFLMIPVTVPLIQNLGIEIQRAKNKHQIRSIVYLFICIANIFISIPCIKAWGASGAALGTAISLTAGNIIFMNIYYHKAIGIDIIKFWKSISKFIPALIPTILCGLLINRFIPTDKSLLILGISIILYCIVYLTSMWFLGMNDEEKQLLSAPLQKIKNRLKK